MGLTVMGDSLYGNLFMKFTSKHIKMYHKSINELKVKANHGCHI